MSRRSLATRAVMSVSLSLILTACGRSEPSAPIAKEADVVNSGGIIPVRAPIRVRDTKFQLLTYNADGTATLVTYDAQVFPVDIFVVLGEASQVPLVLLQRSPHGGCPLKWHPDTNDFEDPCYGSRFDMSGRLTYGPSPRNMDQLPATSEGGVVFVKPEVIYGQATR